MKKYRSVLIILLLSIISVNQSYSSNSTLEVHPSLAFPRTLDWNPEFPLLAIGFDNGTLFLINIEDNDTKVINFNSSIASLKWNNNGSLLAIGTENGINIWDLNNEFLSFRNLELYKNQKILSIDWSSDSSTLYAGSDPGSLSSIFSWNLQDNLSSTYLDKRDYIFDLSVRQDQSMVAYASNSSVFIIEAINNSNVYTDFKSIYNISTIYYDDVPNSIYWLKNNESILTIFNGGNISIWNSSNGVLTNSFLHNETIYGTDYDEKTNQLAVTFSKSVLIYNLTNRHNFIEIGKNQHLEDARDIALSVSKGLLALASFDSSISIWNISDGNLITSIGNRIKITIINDSESNHSIPLSSDSNTSHTVPIYLSFPLIALIVKFVSNKKRSKD